MWSMSITALIQNMYILLSPTSVLKQKVTKTNYSPVETADQRKSQDCKLTLKKLNELGAKTDRTSFDTIFEILFFSFN